MHIMNQKKITNSTSTLCKFYARCFSFPYDEMNYELHHLFRMIEKNNTSNDEYENIEQILSIINQYQGEDIKDIREDFVLIFSGDENNHPLCSLLASEFLQTYGKHYDPFVFSELLILRHVS